MADTSRPGPTQPDEDEVIVGQIGGPWGLRGDLKVQVLTDLLSRFSPGSVLHLKGQPTRVERSRPAKGGILVKLDTISDRTEAESVRGLLLTVPRSDVEPPPEGSYYHFQIIGIGVWSEQGEYLGNVKEILSTGGNDVYVLSGSGRKELLIPALEDVVLEVDLGQSRMTVRLPEGLR